MNLWSLFFANVWSLVYSQLDVKKTILFPFYKNNDKKILRNYRAVTQLLIYRNFFKKLRLLVTIGLIRSNQSGLKPGNSCIMTYSEMHSEPRQTSKMEFFEKIVTFAKRSISYRVLNTSMYLQIF